MNKTSDGYGMTNKLTPKLEFNKTNNYGRYDASRACRSNERFIALLSEH